MVLFSRQRMQYMMANHFSDNPDIWVFGTTLGYQTFTEQLDRRMVGCDEYTSLPADGPVGMDVLIMPTCQEASKPFLVIQERFIFQRMRFNMQLIVGGCAEGFRFLAEQFRFTLKWEGDPSQHVHIDDCNEIVALPCVYLNIRGPVSEWTGEKIGPDYWGLCIDPKRGERVPSGLPSTIDDGKLWSPTRLGYRDLHGRIPLNCS